MLNYNFMNNRFENIYKNINETKVRMKKEHEEFMKKLKDDGDELKKISVKNFSAWRDYLYKYYVLILAFIGGSGIVANLNKISNLNISLGIALALGGVIIGFLGINLYFYFERRWLLIDHFLASFNPHELYDHPKSKGDVRKAIKLNLKEKIKKHKKQIQEFKKGGDKNEVDKIILMIKGDKSMIKLSKYIGEQFGFIERVWLYIVVSSLVTTSIGVILILFSIS